MDPSWNLLLPEFEKPYMVDLLQFLSQETYFPPKEKIYEALHLTPFDKVKVVLIGQDPYHGKNQAEGLAFSVPEGIPLPPSHKNNFKELELDLKPPNPSHGSLRSWAKQGVMLLNSTLTVREGSPKSHFKKGWETFTDKIVEILYEKTDPIVFLLWGNSASQKIPQNKPSPHLILKAPHPSPLSAYLGFFGCRHFSLANEFLKKHNKTEIQW